MTLDEMITNVKILAENDQSISQEDVIRWVNLGINRINQHLQTNIPNVSSADLNAEPEFDKRFHESLVIFAVAKYYESDASYNNSIYYMNQFDDMVRVMQRDMKIKPSQRADYNVQQIVVDQTISYEYPLEMPYGSYFDNVEVYVNDILVDSKYYTLDINRRVIRFNGISLNPYDKITIVYENNSDLNSPPYVWWGW